jgi:hypothetical protein
MSTEDFFFNILKEYVEKLGKPKPSLTEEEVRELETQATDREEQERETPTPEDDNE